MRKTLKLLIAGLLYLCPVFTLQAQKSPVDVIKLVADRILKETSYQLIDTKSNEHFSELNRLPQVGNFTMNRYNEWRYWNGVLGIAFFKMGEQLNEHKYKSYAEANLQFVFNNYNLFKKLTDEKRLKGMEQLFRHALLDDCGAMGGFVACGYKNDNRKEYLEYLKKTADYMLNKEIKLKDGTYARTWPYDKTVWLDDLYMSISFLCRYGNITGEKKYFDFAAKQVELFTKYLYCENTGLYFHCYYDHIKQQGSAHWGRSNGWSILAQTDLLEYLPKDHPLREKLLQLFRQQIAGFSRYQSESGLWHQLLNKTDSYLETSCTAMFTYALAKGINNGWLDVAYIDVAQNGWEGIKSMITEDGLVKNICMGTGTSTSLSFYYRRPTPLNDIHGLGAVILAGLEVSRLKPVPLRLE